MENFNVKQYWNNRYQTGGNSGQGSYGVEALHKAQIINNWIQQYGIRTITEAGCGDANNLLLYNVPISYVGYDISPKAIEICNEKTRRIPNSLKYYFTSNKEDIDYQADLMLSLDVWYHLINDEIFEDYCDLLFNKFGGKYIVIYSTDTNSQFTNEGIPLSPHVRFREVLTKIKEFPKWELLYIVSGTQTSDGVNKNFPSDKKFFLLSNIEKNGKALG